MYRVYAPVSLKLSGGLTRYKLGLQRLRFEPRQTGMSSRGCCPARCCRCCWPFAGWGCACARARLEKRMGASTSPGSPGRRPAAASAQRAGGAAVARAPGLAEHTRLWVLLRVGFSHCTWFSAEHPTRRKTHRLVCSATPGARAACGRGGTGVLAACSGRSAPGSAHCRPTRHASRLMLLVHDVGRQQPHAS